MSKVIITKEGLNVLTNILIGCWPFFIEKSENEIYIESCRKAKLKLLSSETDFGKIIAELPPSISNSILHQIREFSYKFESKITPEVLWDFFASDIHIEKIIQLFKTYGFNLSNPKVYEWLVAHTLLPVYIEKPDKKEFKAQYRNGDISISLSGLVLAGPDVRINFEKPAFAHFATITAVDCPEEKAQYFLSRQSKNKDFAKACKQVGKIDYEKFLGEYNLTSYTKERFTKFKK